MIEKIAFDHIPLLSKIAKDLVYHSELLDEFIIAPPKLENFESLIQHRPPVNRTILVEELLKQNQHAHPNSIKNIELLREDSTYTVTTGHQICSFTGPLYSIYKLISTLNLAQQLNKKYPNIKVVPVFWMATEDHDFDEINHVYLGGKKLEWLTQQKGPVGRFSTLEMAPFLEAITEEVGSDLAKILVKFYAESPNLAIAHNRIINHLFGEQGIVILDADSAALKKEMKNIFKSELVSNHTFDAVENTSEKLLSKGYKKQVTPREINLFYQETGLRERIVKEDETYTVLNTYLSFTEDELLELLEQSPEKFSPNVVMRPMYQETILPNLAYIGGPGELAYWLQLKHAFEVNNLNFPILVMRNMALLLKQNILRKIEKLPFSLADYFSSEHDLINDYIKQVSDISFETEIKDLEQIFELTKEKAIQVDFSLERTVIAELKKAQNSINKISKKVTKAEKNNHEIAVNQIKSIKNSFFPNNTFQERRNNILEYYSPELIKNLMDNLKSLEDNLTLIVA